MAVNADKPERWPDDIKRSVELYNQWFIQFAPQAYAQARIATANLVRQTLAATRNLTNIQPAILADNPASLCILRTLTMPPVARERLAGLAGVPLTLLATMDKKGMLPPRMRRAAAMAHLTNVAEVIRRLIDTELFPWVGENRDPSEQELQRATYIIADRHCGAAADPIIRNEQERRQLRIVGEWLNAHGYQYLGPGNGLTHDTMHPGTYAFRLNVPAELRTSAEEAEAAGLEVAEGTNTVNIPVDIAVKPKNSSLDEMPVLIEAKSAGDFTNTNKRRKEEATKMTQLRGTFGDRVKYALFLCGYFGKKYLEYEASEGIDWVWEHRPDDLAYLGI